MCTKITIENAAVLLIGNELLSGKVRDANLQEIARTLRALGIELVSVSMIGDCVERIADEVRRLRSFGAVFTSGGVGPTHDDVTVRAVARALDVPMVQSAAIETLLHRFHGEGVTAEHLRMAWVPEGARLEYCPQSPWPVVVADNIWLLPGVPEVFRAKLEVVRCALRGPGQFVTRNVYCRNDETQLCPALEAVAAEFPSVAVGSYPQWGEGEYQTHVTFDGRSHADVERCQAKFLSLLVPEEVVRSD